MKEETTDWRDVLSGLNLGDTESSPIQSEAQAEPGPQRSRQKLIVEMERKGRGGKTATIISGFTESDNEVAEIAGRLKKKLGTGGSSRGGEILIQGDRREEVKKELRSMGFKVN